MKTFISISFLVALCLLTSCNYDEPKMDTVENVQAEIRTINNDYLFFANSRIFQKTLEELKSKSSEELASWEKQYGFTSMHRIYLNALDRDLQYYEKVSGQYKDLKFEDIKDIHSEYYQKNENSFFKRDNGTYGMNIFDPEVSNVVNRDGIVQVGGYLFQYTREYFKTIHGTSANHLKTLKNAFESDEELELVVNKVEYQQLSENTNIKTDVYNWTGGCVDDGFPPYRTRGLADIVSFSVPIYAVVPCSASCPTCFLGQCETIVGYDQKTKILAEIYSERKLLGHLWWIPASDGIGIIVNVTFTSDELGTKNYNYSTQEYSSAKPTIYNGARINVTSFYIRFATIYNECSLSF